APAPPADRGEVCTGGARRWNRAPSTGPCSLLVFYSRPDEHRRSRPETNACPRASPGGPEDVRATARADRPGAARTDPRRRRPSGDAAALVAEPGRGAGGGADDGAPGAGGPSGGGVPRRRAPLGRSRGARASRGGIHPGAGGDRPDLVPAAGGDRTPGRGRARDTHSGGT